MYLALVFNVSFIFRKVTLSDHNTSPATKGILTRKPLSTEHTRQYNVLESENVRYFPHGTFILPCIGRLLNISANSLSNQTTRVNFKISSSLGFRNCPWLLDLIKIWLRYWGLKCRLPFQNRLIF